MREKAFERIGHLYPQVDLPAQHGGGKANVIAWIWARTVPSPDPAFAGIDVPIASNFALSTKKGKETWIEPIVDRATKTIRYEIREGGSKEQMEGGKNRNQIWARCKFCLPL
jgi:putative DNA methylase